MARKSLVPFLIFTVLFFLVWSLRATVFYSVDRSLPEGFYRMAYGQLLKLMIWAVPVFAYIRFVERKDPWKFLGFGIDPRRINSAAFWLCAYAVLLAVSYFLETAGRIPHPPRSGWLAMFAANIVSPFSEEVMFRGLILKKLSGATKFWIANVLTSLLFAAIHLPFWLYEGGNGPALLIDIAGVFGFSIIAGHLYRKFGSLSPPVLAHMLNNMMPGLF